MLRARRFKPVMISVSSVEDNGAALIVNSRAVSPTFTETDTVAAALFYRLERQIARCFMQMMELAFFTRLHDGGCAGEGRVGGQGWQVASPRGWRAGAIYRNLPQSGAIWCNAIDAKYGDLDRK